MKISAYIKDLEEIESLANKLGEKMSAYEFSQSCCANVLNLDTWLRGYISALDNVAERTSDDLEV